MDTCDGLCRQSERQVQETVNERPTVVPMPTPTPVCRLATPELLPLRMDSNLARNRQWWALVGTSEHRCESLWLSSLGETAS